MGLITATAIAALAPPAATFSKGQDFAALLGLAPRHLSSGGKQKLGSIIKLDGRTLRRLLIIGCNAVVLQQRFSLSCRQVLDRLVDLTGTEQFRQTKCQLACRCEGSTSAVAAFNFVGSRNIPDP